MIIVSQDREEIVNFNMVTNMFVLDDGNVRCMLSSGDDTFIAKYKTKERAKEVLQEIIKEYRATEAFKVCANRISDKVGAIAIEESFAYEMPEN